jgi:hypothetical protein
VKSPQLAENSPMCELAKVSADLPHSFALY